MKPSSGTLTAYAPPGGPGVRVDGAGAVGLAVGGAYDSLLAKVIVRGRTMSETIARLDRALAEFVIVGVSTTAPLIRAILNCSSGMRTGADWTASWCRWRPMG